MKKCLSITLSVVLLITSMFTYIPANAASDTVNLSEKEPLFASYAESKKQSPIGDPIFQFDDSDDIGVYKKNEAIVTISLPKGGESPLLKEGVFSCDKRIYIKNVMNFDDICAVHVSSYELSTKELIDIFSSYPYVKNVTPNYRLEQTDADPLFNEQWYLDGISYNKEEPTKIPTDSDAPVVAVVDTGIDYTHEDLKYKMWVNPYQSSLPGVYGYDFCNNKEDPFPTSITDSHGTCVAGIIGASSDNGVGISGVSRDAKLMSLKIFDSDNTDNSGTIALQLTAFEYIYRAKRLGVNIVAANCSFCVEPSSTPYSNVGSTVVGLIDDVINRLGKLGVLFVYASGNEGANLEKKPYGLPYQQDPTYLLVTGATTSKNEPALFSNYGKTHVHLLAPGSTMLTTTNRDNFLPASYDAAKKRRLCMFCEDFPVGNKALLRDSNNTCISVTHSSEDIHNDIQSGSGMVKIKDAYNSDSDNYMVYYDVTDYPINYDGSSRYYFSFVFQIESKGTSTWFDVSGRLGSHKAVQAWHVKNTGRYYLSINIKKLLGSNALFNGLKVYFDSFSLSVADPNVSEFGKYAYANGTSFSAPCVSGAVARLASAFTDASASYIKQFILDNVSKKSAYSSKCSSGGKLDLSSFPNTLTPVIDPVVNVTRIVLNKTKATLKYGKKIKLKATVAPSDATNKKVTWKVNKKSYASVSKSGVVKAKKKGRGHTVKITAVSSNKSIKTSCKVKIRK